MKDSSFANSVQESIDTLNSILDEQFSNLAEENADDSSADNPHVVCEENQDDDDNFGHQVSVSQEGSRVEVSWPGESSFFSM